jgi:hypothetical protein
MKRQPRHRPLPVVSWIEGDHGHVWRQPRMRFRKSKGAEHVPEMKNPLNESGFNRISVELASAGIAKTRDGVGLPKLKIAPLAVERNDSRRRK